MPIRLTYVRTYLSEFHNKAEVALRPIRTTSYLTVNETDDPAVTVESLEQSDLVHVPRHCILVGPVQGYALQREDLVRVVHHLVYLRGTTLADEIKARIATLIDLE